MKLHVSHEHGLWKSLFAPFITFVMLFLGAGFISGSIVHLGEGVNPWDVSLLGAGILLFVLGSYIQEVLYNGKNLKDKGTLPFLLYSLLLSLGIGMASGGIQHYVDTPSYSTYLIPGGLTLGIFAFLLKSQLQIRGARAMKLFVGVILTMVALFVVLTLASQVLPSPAGIGHHGEVVSHNMEIKSDEEFLAAMIPHHEEAVATSKEMLPRVQSGEQRAFLTKVISAQTTEINMMKNWSKQYSTGSTMKSPSYMAMMPDLKSLESDAMAWQAYATGMIEHHKGAVAMAKQILAITKEGKIKNFAEKIIADQTKEIEILEKWSEH